MSIFPKKKTEEIPAPEKPQLRAFTGNMVNASLNFRCDMALINDLRRIASADGCDVSQAACKVLYKAMGYTE